MKKGFLVTYSQASIEEYFNLYAEWLFEHPDRLIAAASRYDRVRKKMALAIEFYRKLNVGVVAVPLADAASPILDELPRNVFACLRATTVLIMLTGGAVVSPGVSPSVAPCKGVRSCFGFLSRSGFPA